MRNWIDEDNDDEDDEDEDEDEDDDEDDDDEADEDDDDCCMWFEDGSDLTLHWDDVSNSFLTSRDRGLLWCALFDVWWWWFNWWFWLWLL